MDRFVGSAMYCTMFMQTQAATFTPSGGGFETLITTPAIRSMVKLKLNAVKGLMVFFYSSHVFFLDNVIFFR